MSQTIPCVLMRAGTSRGPFFLREWLPADDGARDQVLIGAIGASDPLQLDGVGGGSTLTSKVAIVSRSNQEGCDLDYLFAQVGVGQRSVDTRPNCGNMLSGVVPFAIEQGLIAAGPQTTTARVYNVNTGSRIDVTVRTPGGVVTYEGEARIDGVAGTAAPILLSFLDAWGTVTGHVFPTGQRIDNIDGTPVTCIDAAMPMMIVRASDLGLVGGETPMELDANAPLLQRIERLRRTAGEMMGLGDVTHSVVPKPVLVSAGDRPGSITSRYFTPHRCHASHAATGAIGVATAYALPGTVASSSTPIAGSSNVAVLHPAGCIDVEVELDGSGASATVKRAALLRTARKIMQGQMQIPDYVMSRPQRATAVPAQAQPITLVVPTVAGGGNDAIARTIAQRLGPLLDCEVVVDNRAGSAGSIAAEFVARADPDGRTLMLGYIGTHAMNPALQTLRYDPVADFEPIGQVASSPTLLVVNANLPAHSVAELITLLQSEPGRWAYASAGFGTAPHFAAELFKLHAKAPARHLPFEGAAPALAATVSGQAGLMFPSLFAADPLIRCGLLRPLAVAGAKRIASLPDVPTLAEAGLGELDVNQWYGLFAPAHTPADTVSQLHLALEQVLRNAEVVQRIEAHGAQVCGGKPGQLRQLVADEGQRWQGVVRQARLRAS